MRKWISRQTLFVQTFLLLTIVVTIVAAAAFGVLATEVERIVSEQISRQTRDTLNIANTKLQNQLMTGLSILVSVRVDEPLMEALDREPTNVAEREQISAAVSRIVSGAFFALEKDRRVAIVSIYGDIYANWGMYDAPSLRNVFDDYCKRRAAGAASADTLDSVIASSFRLTQTGVEQGVYIQLMPLLYGRAKKFCGVAMVLMPEREICEALSFEPYDGHQTFLVDNDEHIISSRNKTLLGTPITAVLEATEASDGYVTRSEETYRTQTTVVDILPRSYVRQQVMPILTRMATYVLLIMAVVVLVCFFVCRSISRPVVKLTRQMVSGNYAAFLRESLGNFGHNEIKLLGRGFDVMVEDIDQLIKENKRKERQKRKTEIAAMQAQIQPHFLFNTLNTARCSILNHHDEKAAELLYKLTMLLRMTLVKGDEMISLQEELETVDYYLDIIRMRNGVKFLCRREIDPVTESFLVPKLLLQPVVENCIVHGFLPEQDDAEIVIHTEIAGGFCNIQIRNNGAALDKEIDLREASTRDSFSGLGIANVNQRLKLYYGERSVVRLFREGSWTVAQLTIDLSPEDADERTLSCLLHGEARKESL